MAGPLLRWQNTSSSRHSTRVGWLSITHPQSPVALHGTESQEIFKARSHFLLLYVGFSKGRAAQTRTISCRHKVSLIYGSGNALGSLILRVTQQTIHPSVSAVVPLGIWVRKYPFPHRLPRAISFQNFPRVLYFSGFTSGTRRIGGHSLVSTCVS